MTVLDTQRLRQDMHVRHIVVGFVNLIEIIYHVYHHDHGESGFGTGHMNQNPVTMVTD